LETGVGTSENIRFYPDHPQIKSIKAIDYSPHALEISISKYQKNHKIDYQIQDVEKMNFKDNSFDTVVDTFGLEYYVKPHSALLEMQRVCKDQGRILILANGISDNHWHAKYLRFKQPHSLGKFGKFNRFHCDSNSNF
jgi:ubiquinone/menaquinone biosynthesis C-methylase UbiE